MVSVVLNLPPAQATTTGPPFRYGLTGFWASTGNRADGWAPGGVVIYRQPEGMGRLAVYYGTLSQEPRYYTAITANALPRRNMQSQMAFSNLSGRHEVRVSTFYYFGQPDEFFFLFPKRRLEISFVRRLNFDPPPTTAAERRESSFFLVFRRDDRFTRRTAPAAQPQEEFVEVSLELAAPLTGSPSTYAQLSLDWRNYFPRPQGRQLAVRLYLGWTEGHPPPRKRLSLRTQPNFRGASDDLPYQFYKMLLANVEYRFPLRTDMPRRLRNFVVNRGYAFVDLALAGDSASELWNDTLRTAIGVGVQADLRTSWGIVPLRVSLAIPTTGPGAFQSLQIWGGSGAAF